MGVSLKRNYPRELELKRKNKADTKASFLDLDIYIVNKKILPLVFMVRVTPFHFPL